MNAMTDQMELALAREAEDLELEAAHRDGDDGPTGYDTPAGYRYAVRAPGVSHYGCPCCGTTVVDEYVEGDALCAWCRDLDDPRLAERVRERRAQRPGPRACCLRRHRGQAVRPMPGEVCTRTDGVPTEAEMRTHGAGGE